MSDMYAIPRRSVVPGTPTSMHPLRHRAAASNARGSVVVSVPRAQQYYWTRSWQENERAAVGELARGEGRRFDTSADAIRWLLSEDD